MSRTSLFRRHGLTGNTKRLVFDALYRIQLGKCAICGMTQTELEEKYPKHGMVYHRFNIDHCHTTGMIRGLLCAPCNYFLGIVENSGILQHFSTPGYEYQYTSGIYIWEPCITWVEKYRDIILLYMHEDNWFPCKDILFHLASEVAS